jgi:hypothetical protein
MGGVENRVGLMTCAVPLVPSEEEGPGGCDVKHHGTRDVCMCAQHQLFILRWVNVSSVMSPFHSCIPSSIPDDMVPVVLCALPPLHLCFQIL